jgi:hypothetical protein
MRVAWVAQAKWAPGLGRDAGFWRRAWRSLSRFWYWIIALALLAASAVVLVLSVRALLVWLNSYS